MARKPLELLTALLDRVFDRLARMKNPGGLIALLFSSYWFVACYFIGTLPEPVIRDSVLPVLFAIWMVSMIRELLYFLGAVVDKTQRTRRLMSEGHQHLPKVSIIVPAFNEELTIAESLKSTYQLAYPNFEVIFVDDGSGDRTLAQVTEVSTLFPQVPTTILTKPNGGKASALNFGILHASGELVMCVDSDSRLDREALRSAAARFEDPQVAAVGGHVYIASLHNLLLKFQQLEYLLGLNFPRRSMSLMGTVPVVPGPVGLFRRDALLSVGGYVESRTNFAEDAELTIRLLARGWKVHTDEDMIAYTEGPENVTTLLRQRYRWTRGMYQAVRAHLGRLWRKNKSRGKGLAIFLAMETMVLPVFNFGMTVFFLSHFFHTGASEVLGLYILYTALIDVFRVLLATHRQEGTFRWLFLIFIEKPLYAFFLQTWAIFCLFDEWRQEEMTWDKLERTGQLSENGRSAA